MATRFESNEILDKLPAHLLQYIKPQYYDSYSPIDQALWRFVMRKNVHFLKKIAHESYLTGLRKTGISTEQIPSMYGMNRILEKIGWAAVAVDGLIPTEAFLEFQSYNVLVIASEIRTLEDIEYTPIPDIIHESAGHAPIIANPEYAEYLRRLGQIGCKAISSKQEHCLFEATRQLTLLKTGNQASLEEIKSAEEKVREIQSKMDAPSEMAAIRNLHWWTVEYGLIGKIDAPRIYGAGLLSSIGESKWCMQDSVTKIPYSVEAAGQNFDYTKPQPQLFVTPDFAHLSYVLEKYANTMALRTGGMEAGQKLLNSGALGTLEMSTGIQVSGYFEKLLLSQDNQLGYIVLKGPVALSYHEKELVGHGIKNHPNGFGFPVGMLQGINLAIEDMSPRDLEAYNIYEGRFVRLEFTSGVVVQGEVLTGLRNLQGKIILVRFRNCTVTFQDQMLFTPAFGIYDMVVGKEIVSGFSGPADVTSYDLVTHSVVNDFKEKPLSGLEKVYQSIREMREGESSILDLDNVFRLVQRKYSGAWLLLIELYELALINKRSNIAAKSRELLQNICLTRPDLKHLVQDGLDLTSKSV